MIAHPGVLDAKPSNLKTLSLSDGREKVIEVVFFSRQRGDLVDFRCLGAQGTRFEAKFGAHRPEPKLSFSRRPGSLWAFPVLFQRILSNHYFWTQGTILLHFRGPKPRGPASEKSD